MLLMIYDCYCGYYYSIFLIDVCYYKPIIFVDVVVYSLSSCIIVIIMIIVIDTD